MTSYSSAFASFRGLTQHFISQSLPMLRRFVLDEWIKAPAYDAFLARHGHKLTDISLLNRSIQEASTIFEHCPALLHFEL
jgi:hypothetical protein